MNTSISRRVVPAGRHLARALALLVILAVPGCAGRTPASIPAGEGDLGRIWGVEIIGIQLSAAGYMLDFRYRVLDAGKAAPLFERKTKPSLIHEKSGARMYVHNPPKIGPMRSSDPPTAGRNYFILFANPGRYIKEGERVTVVIGEFRAEGLVVR
jgi:hypothetical protein